MPISTKRMVAQYTESETTATLAPFSVFITHSTCMPGSYTLIVEITWYGEQCATKFFLQT